MQGLLDYSLNEKKRNFVETVELQIGLKSEHTVLAIHDFDINKPACDYPKFAMKLKMGRTVSGTPADSDQTMIHSVTSVSRAQSSFPASLGPGCRFGI